MKKGLALFVFIIIVLLLSIIAYYRYRFETKSLFYSIFPIFSWVSVDQPILFNHIHHKEVVKLNCSFCHRYVERYRAAGIPNIELCRACHATDAMSKRPEALKVVAYVKANKEIPWNRMYELPKYVSFPHWIHIQKGVDCSICHGLTGVKERPIKMVDRNYMEWCMDCHKKRGASIDCYTCHSSSPNCGMQNAEFGIEISNLYSAIRNLKSEFKMMKINRRELLKLIGAATFGMALPDELLHALPKEGEWIPYEEYWSTGVCLQCPSGCGLRIRSVLHWLVKLEGIKNYPINQGRLCPKGQSGLQVLYDPDRIRHPLKRKGKRGQGYWEKISWDEAIGLVAQRLKTLRQEGHPHHLMLWGGRYRGHMHELMTRFMEAYGSPNHLGNPARGWPGRCSRGSRVALR